MYAPLSSGLNCSHGAETKFCTATTWRTTAAPHKTNQAFVFSISPIFAITTAASTPLSHHWYEHVLVAFSERVWCRRVGGYGWVFWLYSSSLLQLMMLWWCHGWTNRKLKLHGSSLQRVQHVNHTCTFLVQSMLWLCHSSLMPSRILGQGLKSEWASYPPEF